MLLSVSCRSQLSRIVDNYFFFENWKVRNMKCLVAFDFDHTIIHFNSDIVIEKLIPKELITKELQKLRGGHDWIEYMQEIFNILHRNDITKDQILKICENCGCTEGMIDAIKMLKSKYKVDIVIISDSNTVFIEHWLKHHDIYDLIGKIYTNPAKFNSDGLLELQCYHIQDWCTLSTKNMCKGYILEKHLEEEKEKNNIYDVVAFVGDGRNDLCPVLKLKSSDLCFPRVNYSLYKILTQKEEYKTKVKASIHPWSEGADILRVLEEIFSSHEN